MCFLIACWLLLVLARMLWIVFGFGCLLGLYCGNGVACYSGLDLLACGFLFALLGFNLVWFYFVA